MSQTKLNDRIAELVRDFSAQPDWESRYRHIIELGRRLAPMDETFRNEEHKVKGCQSQVWLHARLTEDGRVIFQGDSDALIVKGLVAVLLQVYSGATPEEILQASPAFIRDLGFKGNLSPSRANGLNSMLKQIQHYAVAFNFLQKNKKTH